MSWAGCEGLKWLLGTKPWAAVCWLAGDQFNIQGVMVVEVVQAHPIVAPSYRFYPNSTTESGQMQAAMKVYGVVRGA